MIKFQNLTLYRGKKNICVDLSAEILRGECAIISGGNASGKSSLLLALLGKLAPHQGKVLIDDYDVRHLSRSECKLLFDSAGILFHDLSLRPLDTVRKTLSHKKASKEEIDHMLNFLGMDGYSHGLVRDLSFSEKRKLDLGRALMCKPSLIVLDEPLLGFDKENKEKFLKALRDLNEHDSTIIIATVHPDEYVELRAKKLIELK